MYNLQKKYKEEIRGNLKESLGIDNIMNVPALEKVVISVGAGEGVKDAKLLQNMADTVSLIAGQRAVITKAKKSVAGFKVREGMNVGVKVTLRGSSMYNFAEKLISIAAPRIKDFKGFSRTGFDGNGSYSFGLDEQLVFPEIKYDDIIKVHGMNITFVTTTRNDAQALALLEAFNFPFRKKDA